MECRSKLNMERIGESHVWSLQCESRRAVTIDFASSADHSRLPGVGAKHDAVESLFEFGLPRSRARFPVHIDNHRSGALRQLFRTDQSMRARDTPSAAERLSRNEGLVRKRGAGVECLLDVVAPRKNEIEFFGGNPSRVAWASPLVEALEYDVDG
jgi:hypothetical protein